MHYTQSLGHDLPFPDRDAIERGRPFADQQGDGELPLLEDIPFADLSPGRLSLSPVVGPSPLVRLHPHRSSPSALSPRFVPPPPPLPAKRPPPVPLIRQQSASVQPADKSPIPSSLSPSIPPALQLLLLPSGSTSKKDPGANAAAMLDLKLRRRFAYEWEFLATVLDRVLLIVFAGYFLTKGGKYLLEPSAQIGGVRDRRNDGHWGADPAQLSGRSSDGTIGWGGIGGISERTKHIETP